MNVAIILGGGIARFSAIRLIDMPMPLSIADALHFVHQASDKLLDVLNAADNRSGKQRKLRPLIRASMDVDGLVHFALGQY